ncbi:hypothetical protein SCTVLC_2342 [Serratia symbiotica SCt-VLC]|uniref:Uncharacterized protein n=1 Tax=Serratia symbiotica SCt-VLC TaxID=1347341 RepID=A0A068RDG9_9GAMM|nr:hypothetical protein SCTVLC_2342 [Serratia symbiotica SCt-VLC]
MHREYCSVLIYHLMACQNCHKNPSCICVQITANAVNLRYIFRQWSEAIIRSWYKTSFYTASTQS